MKLLLTLITGLLMQHLSYADCITGIMLEVFPDGPTIKRNSVFILSGTDQGQDVVLGLNTKYNIYLRSGDTKLRLLVVETQITQGNQTQALLKPESELKPGSVYRLCIDSLPENATRRYTEDGPVPLLYRVSADKDTAAPKMASQPKELGKTLIYSGCGPISYVVFSNPAKEDPDVIVKTTVVAVKTGTKAIYYLTPSGPDREFIKVGTGMCAGAFDVKAGEKYEAEFAFMDASGNMTAPASKRLAFTGPYKDSGIDFE